MFRQKRLLLLGGSLAQIPSIKKAKEMGYYAITCDYLPDNPGHRYADEYYNVSTTDKEKVLALAKELNIDGIVCYASDPAAPTAAYVAEKLGLPTSPYQSVEILSNKDLFRKFLQENGFNTPQAIFCTSKEEALVQISSLSFPVIVKPVDSSGSKGVSIICNAEDLGIACENALRYSRNKRIIIEEFVESDGAPLAGDGFSVDGELVFWAFADDYFDRLSLNPLAPVAELYPYSKDVDTQKRIVAEIQRLLSLLKMGTVAYNFEARIDKQGRIYLMEVAPRNGGNGIPIVTRYATGVDMIEYTIRAAVGEDCSDLKFVPVDGFWSTYMVHSNQGGILKEIWISDDYRANNLVEFESDCKMGDEIPVFTGSNGALGTMISKYSSREEMISKIGHFEDYVKVVTKE